MKSLIYFVLLLTLFVPKDAFAQTALSAQNLPKNYLPNGNFESGKAGWIVYKNTAAAIPVTGTGGAPSTTLTTSTSAPLTGKSSGLITHPAGTSLQGEGISMPFSLDKAARGQVQTVSGKYEIVSGTYSGGTATTDSDLEVYIYDVDAGQIIQPASYKLDGGVIGYTYIINATFQASSTSSNYRFIIHEATASTAAYVVRAGLLSVATNVKSYGVPTSDMIAYSPTISGFGTVTNSQAFYRRDGDTIFVSGHFTAGTVAATLASIALPSGLSINTAKIGTATTNVFGTIWRGNSASTAFASSSTGPWPIIDSLANASNAVYYTVIPNGQSNFGAGSNGNSGFATGDFVGYSFSLPVQGWSSNVQMSDQSGDNRTIAARANRAAAQTVPAAANTKIVLDTVDTDKTGTFSVSQGRFNILTPGSYRISGQVSYSPSSAGVYTTALYKNGLPLSYTDGYGTTQVSPNATSVVDCVAGDYIELFGYASVSSPIVTGTQRTFMNIERIGGNTQTAIGESVNATYGLTTAQAVAALGIIKYDTKQKDTHSFYSSASGLWTIPSSGSYRLSIVAYPGASTNIYYSVNGVATGYLTLAANSTATSASVSIPLLAGQTVSVNSENAVTYAAPASRGYLNQATLEKTGN